MRVYLYVLAGITSTLLGWNLGHLVLSDLSQIFVGLEPLQQYPEVVLFPAVALSLAIGMVLNEILLSNPTRLKLSIRIALLPVPIAAGLGLIFGLLAGGLAQVLFSPEIDTPAKVVRVSGWLCIGASIGFAEGFTWRWRSVEAGNKKRFRQRLTNSILFGSGASLAAALLFELLRQQFDNFPDTLLPLEDPIGFAILGGCLGLAFSITSSPSYLAALRAGSGFEYTEFAIPDPTAQSPSIQKPWLSFVSDADEENIEEGLSIQLPPSGKISIGSSSNSQIQLPGLLPEIAQLEIQPRQTVLVVSPSHRDRVEINGDPIDKKRKTLKHNTVVTFLVENPDQAHGKKRFQFVYYNRFLDPQA